MGNVAIDDSLDILIDGGDSMQSKCVLVCKGEVKRKGRAADEIVTPSGKVVYTCLGYKDAMTDEACDECANCPWFWRRAEELMEGGDSGE